MGGEKGYFSYICNRIITEFVEYFRSIQKKKRKFLMPERYGRKICLYKQKKRDYDKRKMEECLCC